MWIFIILNYSRYMAPLIDNNFFCDSPYALWEYFIHLGKFAEIFLFMLIIIELVRNGAFILNKRRILLINNDVDLILLEFVVSRNFNSLGDLFKIIDFLVKIVLTGFFLLSFMNWSCIRCHLRIILLLIALITLIQLNGLLALSLVNNSLRF